MNFNKDKYKKAEAKEFGDFERLELGGHEVVIVDAREYTGQSGKISLKVSIDIAKGDAQEGFFKKQYDEAKKNAKSGEEVKWSTGGTKYISLADEQIEYFKGFITALENSNKGFKFNTEGEWEQLKGLFLAAQFGLEEYEANGEKKVATKLNRFRSLDKLNEIEIPDVKVIVGVNKYEYVPYEEYKNRPTNSSNNTTTDEDLVIVKDEDLPF